MTLQTSKTLGGIGAILLLIGVFPYLSFWGIIELVGLILVLAALYGFANEFRERGIFNYALYGVIITAGIAILLIGWITAIVSTFFFRRSLRLMSAKTNVGLFATAGLLMFLGAILLVLFFFGAIIIWIGVLLLIVAFFTTRVSEPTAPTPPPPPPTTA
jgi:uncharacterized membrane protein